MPNPERVLDLIDGILNAFEVTHYKPDEVDNDIINNCHSKANNQIKLDDEEWEELCLLFNRAEGRVRR